VSGYRSRRAVPFARKARLRGAGRRSEVARDLAAANRAVAPHGASGSGADPAGAADRILLPSLSEVEVEIAASEELVDLAAKGFDAGIRLGSSSLPIWSRCG